MRAKLTWRLEGGYSRFIEGSRVELRLKQGPLRQSLEVSPKGLVDRSVPIELIFQAARTFSGRGPVGMGWSLNPQGSVRALVLFAGNAFLGNFRVPSNHIAIQWDLQVQAEAAVGKRRLPLFIEVDAKTRLYHSWVTLFPDNTLIIKALQEAWQSYRSPLDSSEVLQMLQGQVVRWRWSGRLQLAMGIEWGLEAGWAIPGRIPVMTLQKALLSGAALGARFRFSEEGEFALQLRKKAQRIEFRLRRLQQRMKQTGFSAGVHLGSQLRVTRLSPWPQGALGILTKGLTQPASKKMNQVLKQALVRSLEISLALEKVRWRRGATMLVANWSGSDRDLFHQSYSQLLRGSLPTAGNGMEFSGSFERITGQRVTLHLNVLNWVGMGQSKERQLRQTVRVSPAGDIVIEVAEELKKTRYGWDQVQFLRLLHRETIEKSKRRREFLWSYGQQERFSYSELHQLLTMTLQMGVIKTFSLPPRSRFPLTVQLLVVTRFSPKGLAQVRRASRARRWEALIDALEIADPKRYAGRTFWRDWIDHPELRERIDQDPVQTHLATRYPLGGRSSFERRQVVAAYRRAKRFLTLLEHWKAGEYQKIMKAFTLGLDLPIFVFFHLLCPPEHRLSGALMTGDWEQAWGETELLEVADP